MERNRLARRWMLKYGKEKLIWGVFGFSILITAIALYWVLYQNSGVVHQFIFLIMAIVISITQFMVALANYRQKHNWFTKWLIKRRNYS